MFPVIQLLSCLPTVPAQSAPIPSSSPITDIYQILTIDLVQATPLEQSFSDGRRPDVTNCFLVGGSSQS